MQADPALTQLRTQGDQVQNRTSEAIQPGHHQHVPVPQHPQDQIQLRPGRLGAAGMIDMDIVAGDPRPQQGIDLMVRVLLGGGDPRVPHQHASTISPVMG